MPEQLHEPKGIHTKRLPPLPEPPTGPAIPKKPLKAENSFPISPPPKPPTPRPLPNYVFSPDRKKGFNFPPMPQPTVAALKKDPGENGSTYDDNSIEGEDDDSNSYESTNSEDYVDYENQTECKQNPPPVPKQKPLRPHKDLPLTPPDSHLEEPDNNMEKQSNVPHWKNKMVSPSNTSRNLPLPKPTLPVAKAAVTSSPALTDRERSTPPWQKNPLKSTEKSNTNVLKTIQSPPGKIYEDKKLNSPSRPLKKYEDTMPGDVTTNRVTSLANTSPLTDVESRDGRRTTEPSWMKTHLKPTVSPTADKLQAAAVPHWKSNDKKTESLSPVLPNKSSHQTHDKVTQKPNFRLSPCLPRKNTYQPESTNPKILSKSQNENSPTWRKDRSCTTSPSQSPSKEFRRSPSPTRKSGTNSPWQLNTKPPNVKPKPTMKMEQQTSPSHQARPAPPTKPKPAVAPKENQKNNVNVDFDQSYKSSSTPNKKLPPPLPSSVKPKPSANAKPKVVMSQVELLKSRFAK